MSPQLHKMFYGLHPNNFSKVFRLGGYRPMVFMQSGLAVAIFMWTCAMAGFGLFRARLPLYQIPSSSIAAVLAFLLALCRSLGALFYGLVTLPLLVLAPRRMASLLVLGLAAVVIAYPTLRVLDWVPISAIHAAAASINPDRADSLVFRFENEDQIVDRTLQKPLFGWGGYDRSRVRVDNQEEVRAADGFWVIVLGQRGPVGLALVLTLLVWPLLRAGRRLRRVRDARAHALLLALALIVGIRAFDMMPNGLYGTLPFYLAGALSGVTEWTAPRRRAVAPPAPDRASGPQSAR
jgi:O-antigen ligase